ncbi:MAG: FAD-dependent oxidoreductase [Elusimicrobia bacterium]|nr:FAD-dependent oxidoreductase [Elusimicrobiota bacterium]
MKTDVLIIGGGLSGLSTAYHLNRLSGMTSLVVEAGAKVGGQAVSERVDGFVFDQTGHLLHLHHPYGKRLVRSLLGGNLAEHCRDSRIHSHGTATRYPFQANTYGLPVPVIEECLAGFLETVHWPRPPADGSFRRWCLAQFGSGISRHFMLPYNEKVWRRPLDEINTEWQGPFVPKPRAAEVLCGALTDQTKAFGYNTTFLYPKQGGIQPLADSLASRLKPGQVLTNCRVTAVDLEGRTAQVVGLGTVRFKRLVNTAPLPAFLDLAGPLPRPIGSARRRLRCNRVLCLNLGVARAKVSDRHWIYFPERKFPFYRVGFASNFSRNVAPPGASSLYIEAARGPGEKESLPSLERRFMDGLRGCGLLRPSDRVLARQWVLLEHGYVVYDRDRAPALETIFSFLRKAKVESIGRYGAWKYSFMEGALLDGKICAERLVKG